jgi:hypothetical protein
MPLVHIGDMEEYLIMLGNIHMRHENMLENIFFNMDKIYSKKNYS